MLRQRVLSSIVLVPVIFLCIWFGAPWFSLLIGVAALLGVVEFYGLFTHGKWQPLTVFGTLWTLFFICNAHYAGQYGSETAQIVGTGALLGSAAVLSWLVAVFSRADSERVVVRWAWSLAGVVYMGWLLSYWILLRDSSVWDGRDWVIVAVFSTFAVDTSAYFVGRMLGRHKLAPSISPAKTWEGAVGGFLAGVGAVVLLAYVLGLDIGAERLVLIGVLVGFFTQVGDLAESKLKRVAGVKESGALIPGHGGLLDRLDSIVLTGVLVYYCLRWFLA
jgi:phosphatidate cytidylyltransferase